MNTLTLPESVIAARQRLDGMRIRFEDVRRRLNSAIADRDAPRLRAILTELQDLNKELTAFNGAVKKGI